MSCEKCDKYLYNVKHVTVPCGCEDEYICFIKKVEKYLLYCYPKCFIGLQLYQEKVGKNNFTIVSCYADVPGIQKLYICNIKKDLIKLYYKLWKSPFEQETVLSFIKNQKIDINDNCDDCECSDYYKQNDDCVGKDPCNDDSDDCTCNDDYDFMCQNKCHCCKCQCKDKCCKCHCPCTECPYCQ